jgi:pantothenate synthetase
MEMFRAGERDPVVITEAVTSFIESYPFTEIEYVQLCDPVTLKPVDTLEEENLLALAVRVGPARLIDNCLLQMAEQ